MESGDQHAVDRDPRLSRRTRAPLFDRLTKASDPAQAVGRPFRSLAVRDAVNSIQANLRMLLNTRTVLQGTSASSEGFTSINYGLPDFSHVSATDMQGRTDLALHVARVIEAFEPRLSQVRVTVEPHPSGQRFLVGMITAVLLVGLVPEPVSFPLYVGGDLDEPGH